MSRISSVGLSVRKKRKKRKRKRFAVVVVHGHDSKEDLLTELNHAKERLVEVTDEREELGCDCGMCCSCIDLEGGIEAVRDEIAEIELALEELAS